MCTTAETAYFDGVLEMSYRLWWFRGVNGNSVCPQVDQQLPIRRRVSASGSAGGSPKSRRSRFTPSGVKVRVVPNIQLSRSSSSTSFE